MLRALGCLRGTSMLAPALATTPGARAPPGLVNLNPPRWRSCRLAPTGRAAPVCAASANGDGEGAAETSSPAPSSAHRGPSVKRTPGARVRRTADPTEPSHDFHGRRRVKQYVRHATAKDTGGETRFPYAHDSFNFDGYETDIPELTEAFTPLVSSDRLARLEAVVAQRSFDLMPILEGVYDIGNVLAVCRSTEALGIGCLGVISDTGLAFKQSGRTSGGAVKWTHLQQWRSTAEAVADAKARGYRVLVTVFEGGHPLEHYDWTVPTAVVLGNEREGVSDEAKALADGGVYVSMNGFTESLNVSVASSMIMHHAVQDRVRRRGSHGNLTERERETLRAVYLARLVPNYARQGYLRQLLEYNARKSEEEEGEAGKEGFPGEGEDGTVGSLEETEDEIALLNALQVGKIVKRPRKSKFGRPITDDHARIMQEVELAPERASESGK